jgi:4-oxalomesaconate tautomerase
VLVSAAQHGGAISTRCLIPHRVHASIGVLAAVTVATACLLDGSPAADLAAVPAGRSKILDIEHPSGATACVIELDDAGTVTGAGMMRTARKLFDGRIFG